jgi:hypothetical protein
VPSLREVVLFAQALRLARRAQAVGTTPLPELVASLPPLRGLPAGIGVDEALRATLRAVSRGERWFGWLGTCLAKALVLSALLADRDDVVLVLGVRKGTGTAPIDGHAWVRVGEREISLLGPNEAAEAGYETLTTLPVRAGGTAAKARG